MLMTGIEPAAPSTVMTASTANAAQSRARAARREPRAAAAERPRERELRVSIVNPIDVLFVLYLHNMSD